MSDIRHLVTYCKLCCIGGSEKGICNCKRPCDCTWAKEKRDGVFEMIHETERLLGIRGTWEATVDQVVEIYDRKK